MMTMTMKMDAVNDKSKHFFDTKEQAVYLNLSLCIDCHS